MARDYLEIADAFFTLVILRSLSLRPKDLCNPLAASTLPAGRIA